jgi:bacterioferritin-associated ferredoxin
VIHTPDGLELGMVLCPATAGHARFLSRTALGELLRLATAADEETVRGTVDRGDRIFDEGRRLAAEMGLPVEILDVEVLFDGTRATIHYLRLEECDYRPLVKALSTKYQILIVMQNLALPADVPGSSAGGGCGKTGCGQADGGGCASCGSGGCGAAGAMGTGKEEAAAHLARIRQQAGGSGMLNEQDGGAAAVRDLPGDRKICDCLSVTKDDILAAIRDGAQTVEAVGEVTQAGTGCGTCQPLLEQLLGCSAEAGVVGGEEEVRSYFSDLRRKMERQRMQLL